MGAEVIWEVICSQIGDLCWPSAGGIRGLYGIIVCLHSTVAGFLRGNVPQRERQQAAFHILASEVPGTTPAILHLLSQQRWRWHGGKSMWDGCPSAIMYRLPLTLSPAANKWGQ